MLWKIELFFKILKSGCNAEKLKLRAAERLVNLIAICCILSWRIFWLTMLNRALPNENSECALTSAEIGVSDQIAARAGRNHAQNPRLYDYLREIARLGGYLARSHDPPPGNMIMWRGWSRLMDIQLGAKLSAGKVVAIERTAGWVHCGHLGRNRVLAIAGQTINAGAHGLGIQ